MSQKPTYEELDLRVKELHESGEIYQTAIENSIDGFALSRDGRYLKVNKAFLEIFGYQDINEIIGNEINHVVHPEDRDRVAKIYRSRQHGLDAPNKYEFKGIKKDGSIVYIEISATKSNSNGHEVVLAYFRDVTDRKIAEEALRESEERYRSLFEKAQIGLFRSSIESGQLISCNEFFANHIGYDTSEECRSDYDIKKHYVDQARRDELIDTLSNFGLVKDFEIQMTDKNGEPVWSSMSAKIYPDEGIIEGAVLDITERKQAELEFKNRNQFIQSILDNMPIGVAVNRISDGSISYMNRKFEEIYGWTQEHVKDIGHFFECIYPDKKYRKEVQERITADIESGDVTKMNWDNIMVTGIGGEQKIVTATNIPLYEQDFMISTVQDDTDRKSTENELKKRNEFIEKIMDNLPIGLAVNRISDTSISYVNKKYEEIYGWPKEEVADGDDFFQKVYPGKEELKEKIIADIASGDSSRMQWSGLTATGKDGAQKIISAMNIPLIEQDLMISTVQDITKQHFAQKRLKESEEKFRVISEQSMIAISIVGNTGYLYFNEVYSNLTEFSEAELYAMTLADTRKLIHPDFRDFVMRQARAKLDGDKNVVTHYRYKGITKSGKVKWVEQFSKPIRWADQRADLMTLIDITGQIEAQEAMVKSEEKFRHLAEMLPETIYELDSKGKITYANKAAFDTFMYTTEDYEHGIYGAELIAPDDRERAIENISKILNAEMLGITEYTAVKRDGSTFPVIMSSSPIYHDGEVVGLRGFLIDMTERKELESQLRQAEKMQSIGTLAGGIAHDFNNVLTVILGNIELAIDDTPEWNPVREFLSESRNASLKAKDLIKQLLTFTRKSEEQQRPLNISPIVKESLKLLRSSIPTNIEINQSIPDEVFAIKADPTQIHQILINLVTNASHAIDGRGTVDVSVEEKHLDEGRVALINDLEAGNYLRLTVKDNGSGISPSVLHKIFEPYFTTKEIGKGSGMGLSVVHGIVDSHKGGLEVQSSDGLGTTIHIYFPACKESVAPEKPVSDELKRGTERILVVDDEKTIALLIQRRLERLGYVTESTSDPLAALDKIRENPDRFDLVVTDMAMPNMPGDVLSTEIRKLNPGIPLIICTGYSDKIDPEKAASIGINAFLQKPMDMKDLADCVRNVLDSNFS